MGAIATLVRRLRDYGVVVHEWPGWDGRGNEGIAQIDPIGGILHHTGTPASVTSAYQGLVTGRAGLQGMLCNLAGNQDGSVTVVGSGLAWHAGGGPGPSLGPLTAWRNNLNYRTVGLEIVYPGIVPMSEEQYVTALVFARVVADLFGGGDIERVRAHGETNGNAPGGDGKWDPGFAPGLMIDMIEFREIAMNILEDDVNVNDVIGKRKDGTDVTLGGALLNLYLGAFFGGGDSGTRPVFKTVNDVYDVAKDNNQALVQAYDADGGAKNPSARGIGKIVWDTSTGVNTQASALAALKSRIEAEETRNAAFRAEVLRRLDTAPGGALDVEAIAQRVDSLLAARLAQ